MAIGITDKFKPKNNGSFALMDAADVEMPDGSRLSDLKIPEVKDGVSPTVTVTAITGGHRVTIKDATGTKTFDVMDGKDGQGASITVDSALSATSTNPVQNKVIFEMVFQFSETLQLLQGAIPTLDTTLSEAGKAADAGAVGAVIQQAMDEVGLSLQILQAAIPTTDSINALIDAKLGVIENGSY